MSDSIRRHWAEYERIAKAKQSRRIMVRPSHVLAVGAELEASALLAGEAAAALAMAYEMLGDERTLGVVVDPWGLLKDLRLMSAPIEPPTAPVVP